MDNLSISEGKKFATIAPVSHDNQHDDENKINHTLGMSLPLWSWAADLVASLIESTCMSEALLVQVRLADTKLTAKVKRVPEPFLPD